MAELPGYLRPVSRRWVLAVSMAYLLVTVYFDWITGPTVLMTIFYVLPVGLFTWFTGKRWGYVIAGAAAVLWIGIDYYGHAFTLRSPQLYWNTVVRFGLMVVITMLVDACRKLTGEIETLVAERTARLQSELEARKQAEEAMHALATRVSEAEEAERRRLAHDLHDSVGQDLTGLRLTLETLAGTVGASGAGHKGLADACGIVDRIIAETRGLTRDLYPTVLDDFGLVPALRGYGQQFTERTGIQISVTETEGARPLSRPLMSFLFRAGKELISNAAKHGPARQVGITLRWREDRVRLIVDDDGRGFAAGGENRKNGTGLGLAWIKERAETLGCGGRLELESLEGGGARVILDVPGSVQAKQSEES